MVEIRELLTARGEDEKIDALIRQLDVFVSSELVLPDIIYDKAVDFRDELIRYLDALEGKSRKGD